MRTRVLFFVSIILSAVTICSCSSTRRLTHPEGVTSYTSVRIEQESNEREGVKQPCQEKLTATLSVDGQQVKLSLSRNPRVDPHQIPVILGHHGRFFRWRHREERKTCIYQDSRMLASVSIHHEDDDVKLDGSFHFGGHFYYIRPISKAARTFLRSVMPHVAQEVHLLIDRGDSFEQTPRSDAPRHRRSTTPHFVVELLAVVDHKTVLRFEDMNESDQLSSYFYSVVNEIDTRFGSINSPAYSLSVQLVGFFVAMTEADSPWVSVQQTLNADTALSAFQLWAIQHESDFPEFDAAMGFTGYDLTGPSGQSLVGYAYTGEICQDHRVSLVEVQSMHLTSYVGAHELGHNLGAEHDGMGTVSNCAASDQYIMTATRAQPTVDTFDNIFTFSSCSIQSFKQTIDQLTSEGSNCLTNSPTENTSYDPPSQLPGQTYSLDDQCYLKMREFSYFTGSYTLAPTICERIICLDASDGISYSYFHIAMDGTTCGNHKWCDDGQCVYDDAAPEADDSCLFGDFVGFPDDRPPCQESVADFTGMCYNERNFGLCCESCAQHRTNDPNCRYGDKATGCSSLLPQHCYTHDEVCCGWCATQHTGVTDCEYGDKLTGCQQYHCSYPTLLDSCCGTCNTYGG